MKKGKGDAEPSRADLLIEQAIKAVEQREQVVRPDTQHAEEPSKSSIVPKDSGAIARIDLQQFVDKESHLRLAADFENFRKRAVKERQDAERVGKEKVLREFLDILDNLDRGMQQAGDLSSPLAEGIRMVLTQIDLWLKNEGLTRIESFGQPFDPNVHEAIAQENSEIVPTGHIISEVRRGYKWSDRLLRPAAVIVSRREEPSEGGETTSEKEPEGGE